MHRQWRESHDLKLCVRSRKIEGFPLSLYYTRRKGRSAAFSARSGSHGSLMLLYTQYTCSNIPVVGNIVSTNVVHFKLSCFFGGPDGAVPQELLPAPPDVRERPETDPGCHFQPYK